LNTAKMLLGIPFLTAAGFFSTAAYLVINISTLYLCF